MLLTTTKIICDNCGFGILDVAGNPNQNRITELGIEYNFLNINNMQFCNEKCFEEWQQKITKEEKEWK